MVTPAEMVTKLETALARGAGVVEIETDGVRTRYDRAQALDELRHWQRQVAQAAGSRPKVSSINLSGAF